MLDNIIMYKYIHGSADSIDLDVCYIVNKLPSFQECKKFCSTTTIENRNLAELDVNMTIRDCYIGLPDELNNSLIATYPLHEQEYPMVLRRVERHPLLKVIRATRVILTFLTRTKYRREVKEALRSYSLTQRINVLRRISLLTIKSFNKKKISDTEICKRIAFQTGQTYLLLKGKEVYTKAEISNSIPELEPYLYRRKVRLDELYSYLHAMLNEIPEFKEVGEVIRYKENKYSVKTERKIPSPKPLQSLN